MSASANKPGYFHSAFRAIVEARQRQAELHVNGVLLGLDDETLKKHGYDRAEIARRGTHHRMWL